MTQSGLQSSSGPPQFPWCSRVETGGVGDGDEEGRDKRWKGESGDGGEEGGGKESE